MWLVGNAKSCRLLPLAPGNGDSPDRDLVHHDEYDKHDEVVEAEDEHLVRDVAEGELEPVRLRPWPVPAPRDEHVAKVVKEGGDDEGARDAICDGEEVPVGEEACGDAENDAGGKLVDDVVPAGGAVHLGYRLRFGEASP